LKTFVFAAFAAAFIALSHAAGAEAAQRSYPIHYDGPMVNHGPVIVDGRAGMPTYGVTFHGGPVQIATESFAIYWKPDGTYMDPGYEQLINRFLKDAGGSAIYGIGTAYYGSNGQVQNVSSYGGEWFDRTPYPKHLSDRDLQDEITKAIAANGWPVGLGSQFFIFTSKNEAKNVDFCAYHSAYDLGGHTASPVIYAFVPYVGYFNGCDPPYFITPNDNLAADGTIISVSHEQMEMVTDPLLNAWYGVGGEIEDICIFDFGDPFGRGGANLVVHGDPYIVQEGFSIASGGCQPNL
jgi:hypothetical protein